MPGSTDIPGRSRSCTAWRLVSALTARTPGPRQRHGTAPSPRWKDHASTCRPGTTCFSNGPLEAAVDLGSRVAFFVPQSPNLFWPADLAWCVATEIDLPYTYVGGSAALVEDVLAHPALEAWPAEPSDPVSYDSDDVNR